VICSLSHEGSVDLERSRIRIKSNSFKGSFIPIICHQCADAPCHGACPESAIEIEAVSGLVSIREERCTGCRACEKACSFHAIRFDPDKKRVFKCDLCRGEPACVNWCPVNALGITEFGGTIPK
jgi:anaerobic carbon-monoxide dehydrogenase iron sulfur subunit